MRKRIIFAIACILFVFLMAIQAKAEEPKVQKMKTTAYCPESCAGEITADGSHVRVGIAASNGEHLGDCAMIYSSGMGEFFGYFECRDTGKGKIQSDGRGAIEKGYVIDVWMPDMESAREWMRKTQGEVIVVWVEKPKG